MQGNLRKCPNIRHLLEVRCDGQVAITACPLETAEESSKMVAVIFCVVLVTSPHATLSNHSFYCIKFIAVLNFIIIYYFMFYIKNNSLFIAPPVIVVLSG